MKIKDFDYYLPKNLIAQKPVRPRDHSRLLVLNKETGKTEHRHFYDIVRYLKSGDILVVNDSKVFPARLIGKKAVFLGKVEVFLLREEDGKLWQCLIGGKKISSGTKIIFKQGLEGEVVGESQGKTRKIKFNKTGKQLMDIVFKIGLTPLPPYIKRQENKLERDSVKYQTVYANQKKVGSVAAPTAGFHFTKLLLKKLEKMGVEILTVTLHVGLGTFLPVNEEHIKTKKLHSEWLDVDKETINKIIKARKDKRRIIAVGTTSVRSLETVFQKKNLQNKSFANWTNIFIFSGYKFKVVDAMVTNFHLPQSSLIMLIAAFVGKKYMVSVYKQAVQKKYRFYSYGDAMFIE